jgi:hypothetical protein
MAHIVLKENAITDVFAYASMQCKCVVDMHNDVFVPKLNISLVVPSGQSLHEDVSLSK